MMPEMNGYEVLERLKADSRLRHVPVIMISAVDEIESVVRCIELGAEDYLPKPFNATLLRARIGASLEKKRLRDEVAASCRPAWRRSSPLRARSSSASCREYLPVPTRRNFPWNIHAVLHPARQVGGDLYDFFLFDPQTLCLLVADVSGKGVAAALFMARAKALVRTVAKLLVRTDGTSAPGPSEILAHVNDELCRDNPG